MEDTIFMAVLIALILGAAFLALSRVRANAEEAEEWERHFYRSESGGGGTPYQPFHAHQQKYLCGNCNMPFLFITFEMGPVTAPTCPFCHAREARRWTPADGDFDETREPVGQPTSTRDQAHANGEKSPPTPASGKTAVTGEDPWEETWRRLHAPRN